MKTEMIRSGLSGPRGGACSVSYPGFLEKFVSKLINETKNTLTFFPSELVALAPRHLAHTRKFLEEAAQH